MVLKTTGKGATAYEIIAIASSAGGLNALSVVLDGLPSNLPAAIVVVQHLAPRHRSMMAEILNKRTNLAVKQAQAKDRIEPGHVYIAPPDHHLLVETDRTLALTQTELVHFVRPSADLLFESVAGSFKEKAIGVVLTGSGHDGSMGCEAIRKMGGIVIAQARSSAEFPSMPTSAIATNCVDHELDLDDIPAALVRLVFGDKN